MNSLQSTIIAQAAANGKTNTWQSQMAAMNDIRTAMQGNIATLDTYRVRQGQVLSAQDAYAKKIREGKGTFLDLIKNRRMLNEVMKDQLAIQKSVGISWSQNSKTGKYSVDTFVPKTLPKDLDTVRNRMGMWSKAINVASDNMVNWGKNTQWAGRQLMVGFAVPMGIAAAATGKLAYDLDKQITQVVKVYGDATSSLQENSDAIRATAEGTAKAAARIYGQSAQDTLGIMAALAASGKSGMDLQQSTMATTRAAVLGELDWQDAVKATISMQEVYGASQQELADNWNYINAMENQTVLSAQDFVTAIPKVSGVMNELGATLKDTGALMAAFKAAGIDPAEGANALKSINFRLVASYGKGLQTFYSATGKSLKGLIDETNGETIPTLMKFADAIKDLSAPEKIAVTRDVFGIYQGSKALMLIEQMTEKTQTLTQYQTALNVANNSALQNAAIAQQELDRQNTQPFKKIDKAVETLKINLADLGKAFLEPAAMILNIIGSLVDRFNNLGDGTKRFLAGVGIVVGLAGPLLMMTGLFANLIANTMKVGSGIVLLATRFKMVSVEERMQQIVASKSMQVWDAQTSSVAALTLELGNFVKAMNAAQGASAAPIRMPLPSGMAYNKAGKPMYTDNETHATSVKGRQVKKSDLANIAEQEQIQAAADKTRASMQKVANATTGAALSAGMFMNMFGMTDGVGGVIAETLTAAGIFGMMFPNLLGGAFNKVAIGAKWLGTQLAGMFNVSTSAQSTFLSGLKKAGPIIAAVAIAGTAAWMYFNNQVQDSINKVKEFNDYSKNMADTLGYSYTNKGPMDPSKATSGQSSADFLAMDVRQKTPDAAAGFDAIVADANKQTTQAQKMGEIWGAAIAKGVDAKLHGATVQQAKDTTRVALAVMGQRFDDAQFEVEINGRVNFDDIDSMIKAKIIEYQMALNGLGDVNHSWMEEQLNNNDIFQASIDTAKKAGNDFMQAFLNTDDKDKKALLEKFAKETDKFVNDAYAKAVANDKDGKLKKNGINNAYDFEKNILATTAQNSWMVSGFMDDKQFGRLKQQMGFLQIAAQEAAKSGGVVDANLPSIYKFSDLFNQGAITDDWSGVVSGIFDVGDAFNGMADAAEGTGKKVAAVASAMEYIKTVSGGATVDTEKFDAALQTMGYNAGVTYDSIKESYTNVYTNAQGAIFDEAARQFEEATQSALDASQQAGQDAMDKLDKKSDALTEKYDKKQRAMDDRQKAADKALKKTQDDRKKREENMYDARVKAIEDAIKAEQDAEDLRQKIFDAEQTRIQRLAQMYNTNIDINMAINSGQMDEAAKLVSNAQSQTDQWNVSDASGDSKTASEKRIEDLNKKKDAIGKEKDARMEAIDAIEEREKEALDAKQQREKDALKAEEDRAKKSIDAEKKAQQITNDNNQKALKKRLDDRKRELDGELAALRNHLPSTEKAMNDQMTALKGLYDEYGKDVNMKSWSWAKTGAGYLTTAYEQERGKLASNVEWAQVGQDIASAMLKGAFGMSPQQFAAWINGGEAPANSMFGTKATTFVKASTATPRTGAKPGTYAGRTNDPNMGALHSGGIVNHGGGSGRTGRSGTNLTPSEVTKNLLVGEGVVNHKGMKTLGKAGLDYINSGGGMGGGGGAPMGLAGAIGASAGAALGSSMIFATLAGSVRKRMGEVGTYTGSNSGVQTDFMQNAMNSISAAGTGATYTSGHVVYLGHDGLNRGGDYSGLVRPVSGPSVSQFGPRNLLGMSFHNGIDIAAPMYTPIHAAKGGKVIYTGFDNTGYGNYTEIQARDGSMYGYGHQNDFLVRAGQQVATGQAIGHIGLTGKTTGPHLHFQIGNHGNWFDPRKVMPQLSTGGFIQSDGLAKLHKEEVVLTKPLTQDLKTGVQKLADGGNSTYNVNLNFDGAVFNKDVDVENAVTTALRKIDRKQGGNRKIGGR